MSVIFFQCLTGTSNEDEDQNPTGCGAGCVGSSHDGKFLRSTCFGQTYLRDATKNVMKTIRAAKTVPNFRHSPRIG